MTAPSSPDPRDVPGTGEDDAPSRVPWWIACACAAAGGFAAGPSVALRDAGELSTAAFHLDVAHPTGFPLDIASYRLAMLVPVGDVAFRANLASATWMSLATGVIASLSMRLSGNAGARLGVAAAVLAAVGFVGSRTVLESGTNVEVYALSLLVSLVAVHALTRRAETSSGVPQSAFALGLANVIHTGTRPAALLWLARDAWAAWRSGAPRLPLIARSAGAFVAGLAPILYLPLASRRNGPVDWGDPETPARLLRHLAAGRIRDAYAARMLAGARIPRDAANAVRLLVEDLGPHLLLLAAAGIVLLASKRSRASVGLGLAAAIDFAYAVTVNPMGMPDRQVLFVTEAAACVLAGVGLSGAWTIVRNVRLHEAAPWLAAAAAGAHLVWASPWSACGAAEGWTASEILGGAGALGESPARALVLCGTDDLCGVSLYARYVEGERPDVVTLPLQHLYDPSTWRRLDPAAWGAPRPETPGAAGIPALYRARLSALLQADASRVRWEPGDPDDERAAGVVQGSAETPVLATVRGPVLPIERTSAAWLAARTGRGPRPRLLAARILVACGRRLFRVDPAMADARWEEALALDDQLPTVWTNRAVLRARSGDLATAIAWTRRALELDPERPVAWRNLAQFQRQAGDVDGAAQTEAEGRRHGAR